MGFVGKEVIFFIDFKRIFFVNKFFLCLEKTKAAVNSVLGNQEPDVQITSPMAQDITSGEREAATADVLMTAPSSPIRNHQNSSAMVSNRFNSAFVPYDSGEEGNFLILCLEISILRFFLIN